MFAYCLDPLAHAHREHAGALMTLLALILVNRHFGATPICGVSIDFPCRARLRQESPGWQKAGVRGRLISGSASGYCSASRWTRAETARDEGTGRYVAQHANGRAVRDLGRALRRRAGAVQGRAAHP